MISQMKVFYGLTVLSSLLLKGYGQDMPMGVNSSPVPAMSDETTNDIFNRLDTDHDGKLNGAEFETFTNSLKKVLDPFLDIYDENGKRRNYGDDTGILPLKRTNRLRSGGETKFWGGFSSGILTIWATEIGDKTFFIAAILSMKQDRIVVFTGAISALIIMTVLSVLMGVVATKFLPPQLTHYFGAALFVVFGAKMLYDAREMAPDGPSDELNEVEDELLGKKNDAEETEEGNAQNTQEKDKTAALAQTMLQVFSQVFIMTFLAEWGDRSQIATVTLSATKDAFGVTLGAILGHSMCTGLAVIGGKFLAARISERTVTIIGGIVFLCFFIHSIYVGPSVEE